MSTLITEEDKNQFLREHVYVNNEQIEQAKKCKQRSPEWHKFKEHRIGMSSAGAGADHNQYKSSTELLKDMLWGSNFSNVATEYGNIMEDTGLGFLQIVLRSHFEELGYTKVWIENTGTWIWKEHPWLSASSDGLVFAIDETGQRPPLFGTAENKAPFGLQFYHGVPHHYYDQFQGTAIILNAEFIVFNVYTPSATQMNWYDVDTNYWMTQVFPRLKDFYMNAYLPRAILKERGILQEGQIDINPIITLNLSRFQESKKKIVSKVEKQEE